MAAVTPPAWDSGFQSQEATVANLALARIGADLIKDTTEDTPASRQAKAAFGATRDELLRDYEFNFAQKYTTLDVATTEYTSPKGSWTYVYKMFTGAGPYTAITALKVLEIGGNKDNLFEVVGSGTDRFLLCNVTTGGSTGTETLEIKFVEQIIDPSLWDSLFTDAFVLRLASKLAIPLVKRADLAQFLQSEFTAIWSLAKMASSKERVVDEAEPMWTDRTTQRQ